MTAAGSAADPVLAGMEVYHTDYTEEVLYRCESDLCRRQALSKRSPKAPTHTQEDGREGHMYMYSSSLGGTTSCYEVRQGSAAECARCVELMNADRVIMPSRGRSCICRSRAMSRDGEATARCLLFPKEARAGSDHSHVERCLYRCPCSGASGSTRNLDPKRRTSCRQR